MQLECFLSLSLGLGVGRSMLFKHLGFSVSSVRVWRQLLDIGLPEWKRHSTPQTCVGIVVAWAFLAFGMSGMLEAWNGPSHIFKKTT